MRVIAFDVKGQPGLGVEDAHGQVQPYDLTPEQAAAGALALVQAQAQGHVPQLTETNLNPTDLRLRAAFPRPLRNIFCVGKNYREHAKEFAKSGFDSSAAAGAVPKAPIIFSKVSDCVTGPGAAIEIDPAVSTAIDYEAELLVVIGRRGRGISKAEALDYVWGYSIVNDITARDLQGFHSQWLIGKSQDTFCPMASTAVTANEVDLTDTRVQCWVNDELRQDANTSQLIFDVPTLIATLSAGITLLPGDLIATGTPAGVGIGFNPPRYLKNGDRVVIEIGGIGRLENSVTTRPT